MGQLFENSDAFENAFYEIQQAVRETRGTGGSKKCVSNRRKLRETRERERERKNVREINTGSDSSFCGRDWKDDAGLSASDKARRVLVRLFLPYSFFTIPRNA